RRARAQGAKVLAAYLTTGVPRSWETWRWKRSGYPARVARRRIETDRAREAMGLKLAFWQDLPCRELKGSLEETREKLLAFIRQVDRIWVPAYEGGHQDHDT